MLVTRLLDIIMNLLNEGCNYREDGSFKYIPYPVEKFKKLLEGKTGKFLDVGCGIGDKVLVAKEMGFDAHGIEIDEKLFKIADKYFNNIINIDAMKFDRYNEFDVIYMYRPYKDKEKLNQLRELIETKKNDNCIFIEV